MIITTKVKMDLAMRLVVPCVNAVQDDKYSRDIQLSLYENGVPWEPPAGASAVVRYAKADGKGGNYDTLPDGNAACTIDGNVITVRLAPQVCTAAGSVKLAVGLISNDTEINTFSIPIYVHRNPGIEVGSENYYQLKGSAGYYDLDLTEAVSFETDSTEALSFDVSEGYDWALVQAAVDAGQLVRVHFLENSGVREVSVLLTDVYTVEGSGAYYLQCVYAPRGATNYYKLRLEFVYEEEYGYSALVIFTPGTAPGTQDGNSQENNAGTWLYNGTELPALPQWDQDTYPVAMIYRSLSMGVYLTYFQVGEAIVYREKDDGTREVGLSNCLECQAANDDTEWTELKEAPSDPLWVADVGNDALLWTNTDILNADGSVSLKASDPAAVGSVESGCSLNMVELATPLVLGSSVNLSEEDAAMLDAMMFKPCYITMELADEGGRMSGFVTWAVTDGLKSASVSLGRAGNGVCVLLFKMATWQAIAEYLQ